MQPTHKTKGITDPLIKFSLLMQSFYKHTFAKRYKLNIQKLLTPYQKILPQTKSKNRSQKIAILTYARSYAETASNTSGSIFLIDASLSKSKRHTELTKEGPFDLIIDLGSPNNRHVTLLHTFYHLRSNGIYVIPNGAQELRLINPYKHAQEYLNEIFAIHANNRPRRVNTGIEKNNATRYKMGLAWGIEAIDINGKDIILTRNAAASVRIKLREYEMDRIQKHKNFKDYTTLTSINPQPFKCKAVYNVYGYNKESRIQSPEITQPLLSLRQYKNVMVAPRQIIADNHILFPDTYRLNSRTYLINNALDDVSPRAAVLRYSMNNLPTRDAPVYFHLDNEHRGHFGHLLTETISRIWGWPLVKERHPNAKILLGPSREFATIPEYEYQFYEAAGIVRKDIVFLEDPTNIATIYSAAPLFSNPNYIHPAILDSWKLVGDNLARMAKKKKEYPKRIFCSRKQSRRSCNNGEEIETLFKNHGFTVLYPEEYSLGEQVQLFRHTDVVAGYAGSSLFTVIFAEAPKHVIILRPNTYAAENEFLISALIGGTLDVIISKADDPNSNESSFTVDFKQEGADLIKVLSDLM